uniref:Uncharacterized protein n=1 Tax=Quercus lobata TaxID=97700 RepID=A0A7N2MDQ7_QUELO
MGKGKDRGSGTGETENLLHSAARSGDLNAVQSILSTNNPLSIIVNSRDKHSRTPNKQTQHQFNDDIVENCLTSSGSFVF